MSGWGLATLDWSIPVLLALFRVAVATLQLVHQFFPARLAVSAQVLVNQVVSDESPAMFAAAVRLVEAGVSCSRCLRSAQYFLLLGCSGEGPGTGG